MSEKKSGKSQDILRWMISGNPACLAIPNQSWNSECKMEASVDARSKYNDAIKCMQNFRA